MRGFAAAVAATCLFGFFAVSAASAADPAAPSAPSAPKQGADSTWDQPLLQPPPSMPPDCAGALLAFPWGTTKYALGDIEPNTCFAYVSFMGNYFAGGCPGGGDLLGYEFCVVKFVGGAWRYGCGCNGAYIHSAVPNANSSLMNGVDLNDVCTSYNPYNDTCSAH